MDEHDNFVGEVDDIFWTLKKQIFTLNKKDLEHGYKFHIWLKSMQFRYMMEALFTVAVTILFQMIISSFNVNMNL